MRFRDSSIRFGAADLAPARRVRLIGGLIRGLSLALLVGLVPAQVWAQSATSDTLEPSLSSQSASQNVAQSRVTERTVWAGVADGRGRARGVDIVSSSAVDLRVREGGGPTVAATVRPASDVPRVVYLEPTLSGAGTLRRAASGLAPLAADLTAGGEVWIVQAGIDDAPSVLLKTRDPLLLGEQLRRLALTESGVDSIVDLRRRTLDEVARAAVRADASADREPAAAVAELVAEAIDEEIRLVEERLERMVVWAADAGLEASLGDAPAGSPRLLLPVFDGYDLDPLGFYLRRLDADATRELLRVQASASTPDLESTSRTLARSLAAVGWTVAPLSLPADEEERAAELGALETADEEQSTAFPGVTIRPGRIFGRDDENDEESAVPPVALVAPAAPLEIFAGAAGGRVLAGDTALRDFVERLDERMLVSYPSRLTPSDGVVPLAVEVGDGWRVEAPAWSAAGPPDALASLRLGRVLAGAEVAGARGFEVAAVLEVGGEGAPSTIEARLDLADLEDEGLGTGDLRITVEATGADGRRRLLQETLRDEDLTGDREWRIRRPVDLSESATSVGVLVEELRSGRWGGRRATVVAAGGDAYLPEPKIVEIQPPEGALLRGRTRFEVAVFDRRVARVAFLLDDREVAATRSEPWSARLDLGRTPRRQTLAAVAYDAGGREIGRDEAILNGGDAALAVEITEPTRRRVTGSVEVAADVSVPVERQLDRVLFFWNNEPVATLFAPPFRQRILVPEDRPVGYVRVVALLDDGSLAEDVVFLNAPDSGERVEVQLVELYVVVNDAQGRPVRDLIEAEFRVREGREVREISTFQDASELPLTLGLAIDSSASMFVKLPRVQRAAENFLRTTFSEQDRAFVVDFDSEPRLARGITGDLDRVVRSVYGLEASGRTALWESIVYSLVQLQGVRGRKALIVFSDGADEDDQFPFRSSMSIAREMGVPIYLILMRDEPAEESGLNLFSRSFTSRVDRLVEASGGKVFYAERAEELGRVYAQIEEELRSQYLLAYYPEVEEDGSVPVVDRGDIRVDVLRDDLDARLLSGVFD